LVILIDMIVFKVHFNTPEQLSIVDISLKMTNISSFKVKSKNDQSMFFKEPE
jgi:hypothetical protein